MPTLQQLVEELKQMGLKPHQVRISGAMYDAIIADAENSEEDEPEDDYN